MTSQLILKFAPYLALIGMTVLYLGKRDDLAEAIESCNSDKLRAIAEAEAITREALQAAQERRLAEIEAMVKAEKEARRQATLARTALESEAAAAQDTIRRLRREAQNAETRTLEQECLLAPVPADILDRLRLNPDHRETDPG